MSDSEDQRNETEAGMRQLEATTTSRKKKKLHRRKLDSDDDDEDQDAGNKVQYSKSKQSEPKNSELDDGDVDSLGELDQMSEQQLVRQINALEDKLNLQPQATIESKRVVKAASKVESRVIRASDGQHPAMLPKPKKRGKYEMNSDERKQAATDLIQTMKVAVIEDNEANGKRKPALQKLLLLETVSKELRRIPIQDDFIDLGGSNALADWLYPLPDGTYPNVKVVSEILHVVDTLHIEADTLQNSQKLVRTVKVYAKNRANMPQVQDLAKRIIDKWSRMIFNIKTSYFEPSRDRDAYEDDIVDDHNGYRTLRKKIDKMAAQAIRQREDEEDSDEESNVRKKKAGKGGEQGQVIRGSKGIIMPQKNAFDFVEKPRMSEDFEQGGMGMGSKASKGHENIKRMMNGIKRLSKVSMVNRRMQTVKSDQ